MCIFCPKMLELRKFWNDSRFSKIKPRHVRDISRKTEFYHNTIKLFFFVKCIGHVLVLSTNIYYYSKTSRTCEYNFFCQFT